MQKVVVASIAKMSGCDEPKRSGVDYRHFNINKGITETGMKLKRKETWMFQWYKVRETYS